jgi:hypothetical protein
VFPGINTSISIYVPFSLSQIMMSGLFLGMVLSVCICWFHNMVTLPTWLVSTDFGTCSYQSSLSNFTPSSTYVYWSVVEHTLYHVVWCIVLLPVLGTLT